jgi:hypothetical protein
MANYIQSIQNKIDEYALEQQDIGEHFDFCDPDEQIELTKRVAVLDIEIKNLQEYVELLKASE